MEASKKYEIWHKASLGDEDDARPLNTHIAQRRRTIPHSTMKNSRNIVERCNSRRATYLQTNVHLRFGLRWC